MKFYAWLLHISLLLSVGAVCAEGGCPPGMIPHSGTDLSSCGPIPAGYYKNQPAAQSSPMPPAVLWASKWGAIATDVSKGSLGTSVDMGSKTNAEQAALADCKARGGSQCSIEIAYDNECAAMVVGHPGYNVTTGATQDEALQAGMKTCNSSGNSNCHVYYSGCSLPQQIP